MAYKFKKAARQLAYNNGVTHCPCCKVQLVWKPLPNATQKNFATVDHIVPNSMGGANVATNMFVMCQKCNHNRDTECFVKFVTRHGVSKTYAEEIYRRAHVVTLQVMIQAQFTQNDSPDVIKNTNKRRRANIRRIVQNYVDYFGDHLPEFELLEKIL